MSRLMPQIGSLDPAGLLATGRQLGFETRALALACAVVGSLLLFAATLPVSVQPHRVPSGPVVVGGSDMAADTRIAEQISFDFAHIQARPIFLADRRPLKIANVTESVPANEEIKPDAGIFSARKLVGIIEEDQVVRILLWSKGDGGTILLRPGDPLGLWTFDRIEGETAVFVADQQQHRLVLKERDESAAGDAFVRKRSDSRKVRRNRRP